MTKILTEVSAVSVQSHRGPPLFLPHRDALHVSLRHHVHHHPASAWKTHGLRSEGTIHTVSSQSLHVYLLYYITSKCVVVSVQLYNDSTGKIWRILRLISGGGNTQCFIALKQQLSDWLSGSVRTLRLNTSMSEK